MNAIVFPPNPGVGEQFGRWIFNGKQWINLAVSGYAPLDSPDFSGMPTAPTPPPGSDDAKLATTAFVMNAVAAATAGVASFNTRTGHVTLLVTDIVSAGGAPINAPHFTGLPEADTPPAGADSQVLATTHWVNQLIGGLSLVSSFNTRMGHVTLLLSDLVAAGGAPIASPYFIGTPRTLTPDASDNSTALATTAYVTRAITDSPHVSSWNQRTGDVVFRATDLSAVGGALLAGPHFTGVPTAPTAPPANNSTQLATTAYVDAAIASNPGPPGIQGPFGPAGPPGPPGPPGSGAGQFPLAPPATPAAGSVYFNLATDSTLVFDGTNWLPATPLTPAMGPNGAIQFNNNGAFGGSARYTYAQATGTVTLLNELFPTQTLTQVVDANWASVTVAGQTAAPVSAFARIAAGPGTGGAVGAFMLVQTTDGLNQSSIWPGAMQIVNPVSPSINLWTAYNMEGVNLRLLPNVFQLRPVVAGAGIADCPQIERLTGNLLVPGLNINARSVAQLPVAAANYRGFRATVTDALNPTGIVQGGGANTIPVFCDGTNWISGYGSPDGLDGQLQFNMNGALAATPYIGIRGSNRSGLAFTNVPWTTPGAAQIWLDGITSAGGQQALRLQLPGTYLWTSGNIIVNNVSNIGYQFGTDDGNITHQITANQAGLPTIGFYGATPLVNPVSLSLQMFTVATLPVQPTTGVTQIAFVSDATTRNGVVAGGGTNIIPVYHDGSNWRAFQD